MKKIFNLLIALYPILSGYGLSLSLDFGSILLFVFGVGCVIAYPQKYHIKMPEGYMLFFVVALLLSLIWARSVPLRLLLFSVNLGFACCFVEKNLLWKYYSTIVWICVAFFMVQEVLFYILGSRPSGLMPFLPTVYGGDDTVRMDLQAIDERSSSFFLEPSYFAQFMIPFVAISLFSMDKKEQKNAIVATVMVILIRSGVGVLLLGIIWLLWFFYSNIKNYVKIVALSIIVITLSLLLYVNGEFFDYFVFRSNELLSYTGDEKYQSSGFIRIFRGYFAFAEVSTINQYFGLPPDRVHALLDSNIYFAATEINFINGMQTLLFYHGIVGAILYLRHLLLFPFKSGNKTLLTLSVIFVIMLLTESYYLSSRSFLMTVFMFLIFTGCNKISTKVRRPNTNTISI